MNIEIGSHIYVHKKSSTFHGIYIGNNQVIHYSGITNGYQTGPVTKVNIAYFSGMGTVYTRNYNKSTFTPIDIVNRAKSKLGQNLYIMQSLSCEDFCSWAVNNNEKSSYANKPASRPLKDTIHIPLGAHIWSLNDNRAHHGIYIGRARS